MIDRTVARRIRLVGLDVDGTLTDGGVYLGDVAGQPTELKRYDIHDGVGVALLKRAGILVAIITGRVSESVKTRARELNADAVVQDASAMKLPGFLQVLSDHDVALEQCAFVGDDFPDAPILQLVALPVAVGNAVPEIREMCAHVLERAGGRGAIREFAELLLKARGEWESAWSGYVEERSTVPAAER